MKKVLFIAAMTAAILESHNSMAEGMPMVSGHSPEEDAILIGRRPCPRPFLKEIQEELDRLEQAPSHSEITVDQQRFTLSVMQGTDADGNPQLEYTVYTEDHGEDQVR